jgi:hypothetical protein
MRTLEFYVFALLNDLVRPCNEKTQVTIFEAPLGSFIPAYTPYVSRRRISRQPRISRDRRC